MQIRPKDNVARTTICWLYVRMYACMYACMHVCMYAVLIKGMKWLPNTYMHVWTYILVCMYAIPIYVCMCVCMCIKSRPHQTYRIVLEPCNMLQTRNSRTSDLECVCACVRMCVLCVLCVLCVGGSFFLCVCLSDILIYMHVCIYDTVTKQIYIYIYIYKWMHV